MLQPASNRDVGGMGRVGLSSPAQQMPNRSVHPRLYSPSGYNPVDKMPDTSPKEPRMSPMSAIDLSDFKVVLFLVSLALMVPCLTTAVGMASDG